jgi:predicted DNA-binding protein
MTDAPGGVRTLAIRLPDELHAQLVLVASLDGVSLAEAIRAAVETGIARRRDNGELAAQAQAALEQIEREASRRRAALSALLGPAAATEPAAPAADKPAATPAAGPKPTARRRNREAPA